MSRHINKHQKPLFERWERAAYRGARTKRASGNLVAEFLAMVKKCDCGKWHLEMGSKCKGCEGNKTNA